MTASDSTRTGPANDRADVIDGAGGRVARDGATLGFVSALGTRLGAGVAAGDNARTCSAVNPGRLPVSTPGPAKRVWCSNTACKSTTTHTIISITPKDAPRRCSERCTGANIDNDDLIEIDHEHA